MTQALRSAEDRQAIIDNFIAGQTWHTFEPTFSGVEEARLGKNHPAHDFFAMGRRARRRNGTAFGRPGQFDSRSGRNPDNVDGGTAEVMVNRPEYVAQERSAAGRVYQRVLAVMARPSCAERGYLTAGIGHPVVARGATSHALSED